MRHCPVGPNNVLGKKKKKCVRARQGQIRARGVAPRGRVLPVPPFDHKSRGIPPFDHFPPKMVVWSFHGPAWLWIGGKRSRQKQPDRATLGAQSTRHGARPGSNVCRTVQAGVLRAPQPERQKNIRARRRRACPKTNALGT